MPNNIKAMIEENYKRIANGTAKTYDSGSRRWKINISPDFIPSRVVVFINKFQYTPFGETNRPIITNQFSVCDSNNPESNYEIRPETGRYYRLKIDKFDNKTIDIINEEGGYNYLTMWVTWVAIE